MANLIGSWFPDRTRRVVIGAHYDTRPHPDQEFDPALRQQPFLGANDGASGVAMLMELAHHLSNIETPWGIDLVLFDGEELVYERQGEYFLGSKHFARQYKADRRSGKVSYTYVCGIVVDMVAEKNPVFPRDPYSLQFAGRLTNELWSVARKLGIRNFVNERGPDVLDDHLPLNDAGIPSVDIIDFDYEHWHMASDTPEQCGPEGLVAVGKVLTAWLALPAPEPAARKKR
jgi:Zn-dependent M28 family amino/carboxypeptidase